MARKPKRPAPITVGPVKVTAVRPRGKTQKQDGRWYWQAVVYEHSAKRTVWSGWATRDEAWRSIPREDEEPSQVVETFRTVCDLVEHWAAHQEERHEIGHLANAPPIMPTKRRHAI